MKTQERKRVIPYFILLGIFLVISITLKATNAPITTAATVCNAVVNQQVTVPITVTGFSNISGFTLTMDYDYAKLHFVKASSTSNSALGGVCDIGEINMGGNNRRVTISWYRNGNPGITLPDGTAIANYVFTYISGPATLTWFDMGPSCVYNDPDVNTLSDTPTSTYYINGLISGSCLNTPTITPDGPTSFCEGDHVNLTASAGTAWKWSTNETTQNINVTSSGSYTVEVTDAAGVKATSAATVVTVTPLPTAPTADITQPTCTVATGTITVSSAIAGLSFSIDGSTFTNTNGIFAGLNPGDYHVTARNEAGCVSPQSILLTINAQPTVSVENAIVTPTSVIGSGQVLFSATASSGTIKWYDAPSGGTEITNLNPTISETTTYYAEATSAEGCISTPRTAVTATVIPLGTTRLTYRLVNPRIANSSGNDYFEFDVQVKADVAGTYLWKANINLNFNNSALSADAANWFASPVTPFNGKYSSNVTITGSTVNIEYKGDVTKVNSPASATDFTEITTAYQTVATVRGKITDNTGEAGIDFNEPEMNGKQFYKLSESPWYASYANPNMYDPLDFMDIYVGRIFADNAWTQVGGLVDWSKIVNTSVWDGSAEIPGGLLANALNLRIHRPATLKIPYDGKMTIAGNTDIKQVAGLTLESSGSGTGSFITETTSGAGSAVVQRFMTTDAWHIVSSPVSGQSIVDFLATNNNVATDDASLRGMMDYNPELNQWNDYFTNSTVGDLGGGKGFCLRTNANSAVSFNGHLQPGNQIVSGLSPDLWNCVGNPYTSAIGINSLSSSGTRFLEENAENLDPSYGAIYVWDNGDINNGVWGKYTIISNTPTPDTGFDVQQGQAFMVKMKPGTSTINFNSGMQIHEPALPLKSIKSLWPTIKLEATVAGQKVSTLVAFNGGMTKGLDPTYDAGLLKGGSGLDVYSRLVEDNGFPFAIQALPSNEYESLIIPIGIDSKSGGEVVFSSELMNLPSDCQVILEDKSSHTFTDLSKNVYSTILAANSSISDRFQLHTSYLTTGLDMTFFTGQLSAFAIRNIEIRVNGNVTNQAVATLYDVQGRMILVKKLEAGSLNTIRTPNIRTGIYMLFVKDNDKLQGFKIPVRE